jgi:hypothetical protein
MSIRPFQTNTELLNYSRVLLRVMLGNYRKDMSICLRRNGDGSHAYFPALMTSIGFLDFLSGLYAGTLEHQRLDELKAYASRFMNPANYDSLRLEILYEMFRHKLAHLGYLPVVFDTTTTRNPNRFSGQPPRRITWTVCASGRKQPIEIKEDFTTPQYLKRKHYPPWRIPYDCRVYISLRRIQTDIRKSIYGRFGYLRALEGDPKLHERFAACMRYYFPPP